MIISHTHTHFVGVFSGYLKIPERLLVPNKVTLFQPGRSIILKGVN